MMSAGNVSSAPSMDNLNQFQDLSDFARQSTIAYWMLADHELRHRLPNKYYKALLHAAYSRELDRVLPLQAPMLQHYRKVSERG